MLPPGFIEDLLARTDVAEVVGRHVQLRKAGINLLGLCPFHAEKSPSFTVSPSKQFYHCFGCGAHGDAIRFLTEHVGLGFMEAVRDLAQQAGLKVPQDDAGPEQRARRQQQQAQRQSLQTVLAQAAAHYRAQLKAAPGAIAYLKRRGLSGEIAARFGLGYAPEGWRTLANVFPRYDDALLVEAGLVIVQGEELEPGQQRRYDRFRDRIMFPIRSVQGEIIGFGGRVLDRGEPKYLNSPETPLFHKGRELYGLHEAHHAIRRHGAALVVEGYMDVVALAQAGIGHAVATLGTACTADHVAKLLRFTDTVVFSFDGDAAGRRAAGRALEACLPHAGDTRSFRFLFLPPEHDPDSFVRAHGPQAFAQAEQQAVPLSEQLRVHVAEGTDLTTAEGRARMLAQARPLVALLPAGLFREQMLQALAEQGGVAVAALQAHWAPAAASPSGGQGSARPAQEAVPGPEADPSDPSGERSERGGRRPLPPRPPGRWAASRRNLPQTATRLDRAAWLLARHADRWLSLPEALHHRLCDQPRPHGIFFRAFERLMHEHGPVTLEAVLAELSRDDAIDGEADLSPADADAAWALQPLLARIASSHSLQPDPPVADLDSVLRQLEGEELAEEAAALAVVLGSQGPEETSQRAHLAGQLREVYARMAGLRESTRQDAAGR